MAKELLNTPKGKKIKLADGKTYTMAALNLNVLANLEEAFDCDFEQLEAKLTKRSATGFRTLLWVLLRDNYPDITLADAGKLVQLDQMIPIINELTTIFEGLKI